MGNKADSLFLFNYCTKKKNYKNKKKQLNTECTRPPLDMKKSIVVKCNNYVVIHHGWYLGNQTSPKYC